MSYSSNEERAQRSLTQLASELDVPLTKYQEAKDRYSAVTEWLGAPDSNLEAFEPSLYPQGSFAIGTAVRPIEGEEYDVDVVCLLKLRMQETNQKLLKALVGDRLLHEKSRYRTMVDPKEGGRRCWTIRYAEAAKFHLDILPAVPDDPSLLHALGVEDRFARHAIAITDRATWGSAAKWPRSNPRGYAEWFLSRAADQLAAAKVQEARLRKADVTHIQDFEVRTPLQQATQVLKRHRDARYAGDDDKPISIIVSTLVAKAYSGEADVYAALRSVIPRMRAEVGVKGGKYLIANPVNPRENFADKWTETPRKAKLFHEWLESVERDLDLLTRAADRRMLNEELSKAFGGREAAAVVEKVFGASPKPSVAAPAPAILVPKKSNDAPKVSTTLPESPMKPWA